MAFQTGPRKGPVSEINVTPLVDVMLVLLVIFMVTAPMMFSGIQLKLPKTQKVTSLQLRPELIVLSVTANEEYFLGKIQVKAEDVVSRLKDSMKQNADEVVYLRADYALKYEKVARLISLLKRAGIGNIALVTETENEKG